MVSFRACSSVHNNAACASFVMSTPTRNHRAHGLGIAVGSWPDELPSTSSRRASLSSVSAASVESFASYSESLNNVFILDHIAHGRGLLVKLDVFPVHTLALCSELL